MLLSLLLHMNWFLLDAPVDFTRILHELALLLFFWLATETDGFLVIAFHCMMSYYQ